MTRRKRETVPRSALSCVVALRALTKGDDATAIEIFLNEALVDGTLGFPWAWGYAAGIVAAAPGEPGGRLVVDVERLDGETGIPADVDDLATCSEAFIAAYTNEDIEGAQLLWRALPLNDRARLLMWLAKLAAKTIIDQGGMP